MFELVTKPIAVAQIGGFREELNLSYETEFL